MRELHPADLKNWHCEALRPLAFSIDGTPLAPQRYYEYWYGYPPVKARDDAFEAIHDAFALARLRGQHAQS